MSTYRRMRVPGGTYFFTVALADRSAGLLLERIHALRCAYAATWRERPFHTEAVVILPDHLHAVWTLPAGDSDYSTRWGAIKARFTMAVRRGGGAEAGRPGFSPAPGALPVVGAGRYAGLKPGLRAQKREQAVWQRRFWEHCIRDEADFAAHIRYCWGNPVKHGLVARPADWPYSSLHRDIRAGRAGPDWHMIDSDGQYGEPESAEAAFSARTSCT